MIVFYNPEEKYFTAFWLDVDGSVMRYDTDFDKTIVSTFSSLNHVMLCMPSEGYVVTYDTYAN